MSRMVKVLNVPSRFRRRKYLFPPAMTGCRVLPGGTQIVGPPGIITVVPMGGASSAADSAGSVAGGTTGRAAGNAVCK